MSIKKKIKIAAGSVLGVMFLLFAVLIVHIAIMVKGRKPLENPTIQMARADFKNQPSPSVVNDIERKIKKQAGVKDVLYNPASKILIYSFDAKINSAQNIYNTAIKSPEYQVSKFMFAKADEAKGCPAMDTHSFYGKLTSIVENVIN